jgi:DNA-binding beta-propeller fold protein YncE
MRNRIAVALVIAACNKSVPASEAPTAHPARPAADGAGASPLLLVANKAEATLSVLELPAGNELARLPTGVGPHEVAVSPDGRRAVVSNYGNKDELGRTLTVVDLAGLSVANTIDLGELRRPHGIAFLDDRRVVVTAEVNAAIAIVDIDAGKVERAIATTQQGSHMLVVAPGKQRVYVANIQSGSITPIDLASAAAGEPVPAIAASEAIAVTPDGAEVWTASLTQNKIVILDAPQLRRDGELEAAGAPIRITPTPDGKMMLVSNAKASKLQLIDVASRAITTIDLPVGDGDTAAPVGTTISSDSKTAYVALVAQDRVAVVDLATKTITGHLLVGKGPDGIAYCSSRPPPRAGA